MESGNLEKDTTPPKAKRARRARVYLVTPFCVPGKRTERRPYRIPPSRKGLSGTGLRHHRRDTRERVMALLRIPMMSISHSDLMPIRTERSDAGPLSV